MIKYVLNRQIQQTPLEMFAINGSMCSDKDTIAHAFNEYFTNLGPTLAGKIPNLSRNPLSYLITGRTPLCFMKQRHLKLSTL